MILVLIGHSVNFENTTYKTCHLPQNLCAVELINWHDHVGKTISNCTLVIILLHNQS